MSVETLENPNPAQPLPEQQLGPPSHEVVDPRTGDIMRPVDGIEIEIQQSWASEAVAQNLGELDEFVATTTEQLGENPDKELIIQATERIQGVLSPLSILYLDPKRVSELGGVADRLAAARGQTTEEFIGEKFSVSLPVIKRHDLPEGLHEEVAVDKFVPKTMEDYFAACRLEVYSGMQRGDDVMAHGTHHVISVLESGAIRPKARHEAGKVHFSTGLSSGRAGDLPTSADSSKNQGEHSLLVHFDTLPMSAESLPLGYGRCAFMFPRRSVIERSPISLAAGEASSKVASARAEISIDDQSLETASDAIRESLKVSDSRSARSSDEAYAASMDDVAVAGDYEYPLEEGVMVFWELDGGGIRSIETLLSGLAQKIAKSEGAEASELPDRLVKDPQGYIVGACELIEAGNSLPEGSSEFGAALFEELMAKRKENPEIDFKTLAIYTRETLARKLLKMVGHSEDWVDNNVFFHDGSSESTQRIKTKLQQLATREPGKSSYITTAVSSRRLGYTQDELNATVPY